MNVVKRTNDSPIKVYGCSDDLAYLEGGMWEEVYGQYLAFSEGTVLRVTYGKGDRGIWTIVLFRHGKAVVSIQECHDDDADVCSDIATLEGEIEYVVVSNEFPPSRDEYHQFLDTMDWDHLDDETLRKVFRTATGII